MISGMEQAPVVKLLGDNEPLAAAMREAIDALKGDPAISAEFRAQALVVFNDPAKLVRIESKELSAGPAFEVLVTFQPGDGLLSLLAAMRAWHGDHRAV